MKSRREFLHITLKVVAFAGAGAMFGTGMLNNAFAKKNMGGVGS